MESNVQFSHLESLGYSQYFENNRLQTDVDLKCVFRIIAEHKGLYEIINQQGEFRAVVSGKLMRNALYRNDYPAVGDWVVVRENSEDVKVIEDILPRRTFLRRKYSGKDDAQLIASNVDVAFVVESMDRDYSVNRFERYIILVMQGGVEPVIILNKSDLISKDELFARIDQLNSRFPEVRIFCTNTVDENGVDELSNFIKRGITYCFLGSSGVGKSSLINKLLGTNNIETKEIGEKTQRGKHTTTAREMYFMPNGGIIIDNPGSREVGLVDFGAESKKVFVDIDKLAKRCKYKDCTHISEPDCAVLKAVKSGEIDASQYDNFLKLRKEAEHYEMNSQEKRQKDRQFGRFIKRAKEDINKYKS